MKRPTQRWNDCDAHTMAHEQSRNAIEHAFNDAKSDILEMANLLRVFAYPRKGTSEESLNEYDIAKIIQDKFKLEELEIN